MRITTNDPAGFHQTIKSNLFKGLLMPMVVGLLSWALLTACEPEKKEAQVSNWSDLLKSIHPEYAWLTTPAHLQDSTYSARLVAAYSSFLSQEKFDTALFYLIGAGDILDRHYQFNPTYLQLALNHIAAYESDHENIGEVVKLYHQVGSQYGNQGQYQEAKQWYYKGLNHPNVMDRTKVKCWSDLATIYRFESKLDSTIALREQLQNYYESIGDKKHIGLGNNNLAIAYEDLKAYRLAEIHFNLALSNEETQKDSFAYCQLLYHHINFLLLRNASSDTIAKRIRLMEQVAGRRAIESPMIAYALNELKLNLALNSLQLDQISALIDTIKKHDLLLSNQLSGTYYYANFKYKLLTGQSDLDLLKMDSVFKQMMAEEDWYHAGGYAGTLHKYFKNAKDFEQSLHYHELSAAIDSQIYASNSEGQLYELSVKYETDKKEQAIKLQEAQLISKQQNIYLLISLLISVMFLVGIYYVWQKQVQLKQKQLVESQFSQQLMENTELERQRIAKELHDSVGHQLLDIKNSILNEIKLNEHKVDEVIQNVRDISRNLFPVMFEQVRLIKSIEAIADTVSVNDGLFINLEIDYPENSSSVQTELQLYRIIQEAVNNIRKHANAKSAKIGLHVSNAAIHLTIQDNGVGFDTVAMLHSGKSFGLQTIQKRVTALKGSFQISSTHSGTTIEIDIPIFSA